MGRWRTTFVRGHVLAISMRSLRAMSSSQWKALVQNTTRSLVLATGIGVHCQRSNYWLKYSEPDLPSEVVKNRRLSC